MRQLTSMKKFALLLAVVATTCLGAATGHAENNRTWVSGTGSDSGSCTRTAPCLTFAYAIGQTNSGGEIDCLDPGGFGAVTITIPVTIDCEGVSYGGVQVGTGATAIYIYNTTGHINLIGLDINGENASGGTGVWITSNAVVNIRNCKIYGFATGSAAGITSNGGTLVVDNVLLVNNYVGIFQFVSSGISNMTVRNSNINNNSYGVEVENYGGTHTGATIEQTTLAFNGTGLIVQNSGAIAVIGGSTVVNNGTGVGTDSGGILYSAKNNQIYGNSTDGTPLTAYPGFSGGGA